MSGMPKNLWERLAPSREPPFTPSQLLALWESIDNGRDCIRCLYLVKFLVRKMEGEVDRLLAQVHTELDSRPSADLTI
jgi:hypothetical protein